MVDVFFGLDSSGASAVVGYALWYRRCLTYSLDLTAKYGFIVR